MTSHQFTGVIVANCKYVYAIKSYDLLVMNWRELSKQLMKYKTEMLNHGYSLHIGFNVHDINNNGHCKLYKNLNI
jgi:hypothetical protein